MIMRTTDLLSLIPATANMDDTPPIYGNAGAALTGKYGELGAKPSNVKASVGLPIADNLHTVAFLPSLPPGRAFASTVFDDIIVSHAADGGPCHTGNGLCLFPRLLFGLGLANRD